MPYLPVALAAALAAGSALGVLWPAARPALVVIAVAAWAGAVAAWRYDYSRLVVSCGLAGVVAASALLGATAFSAAARPPLVVALEESGALADDAAAALPVRLEGVLTADAAPVARGVVLRVQVARIWTGPCGCPQTAPGAMVVTVAGSLAAARMDEWRAGRHVTMTATARLPRSFRDQGVPDARADLVRRRAALVGTVKSAALVEPARIGSIVSEAAAAVRARTRAALRRAAGPSGGEAAAIGAAVLIGDRVGLDPELQRRLQRAGTYHVIAISGGNIALVTVVVLVVARAATRHRRRRLLAAGLALVAYAAIVGGGASVLRATGMALVGMAAQMLDQRGAAVNVLALTAGVLLAADPLLAFDVGFWLTTAATAGIMLGLAPGRPGEARWRRLVRTLLVTSVWAEVALLPVAATVFQQVTVAGVVLSAIAIPGMALAQMAAARALAADLLVPPLLPLTGVVLRAGALMVTESARVVDFMPWLAWHVPPPALGAVVVYYAACAAWLWARHPDRATALAARVRRVSTVAFPAAVMWVAAAPLSLWPWAPGDLRVTALDVGQGEALLVQFPNGRRLLVDAGGVTADGRDLGDRVVGPALRARGVRRVDYLLVTHADADHIGGAASLVGQFTPHEVWTGIPVAGDVATAALHAAADEIGATWRRVAAGDHVDIGQVRLDVLHPAPADWERQRVRNDDSVAVSLGLGRVRVLLTGDIGAEVEPSVLAAAGGLDDGVPRLLTVLKVAHHGSAGSSSEPFLTSLHPAVALVSAGAGNRFGHPAPPVLARLDAVGADLWRTDRDGEITVRTDGRAVELSSFIGRRRWLHAQPR
ncbi:MAG: DNA internalization-related competence protein ComEC/Rec2 [Acidobacteriota bacterium]